MIEWKVPVLINCNKKWWANFQHGDFKIQFAALSGRPSTVSTHGIVDHGLDQCLAKQQILAKRIADTRNTQAIHWVYGSWTVWIYSRYQGNECQNV